MEAVLTCMVDEKIGPGDMNVRLVQLVKEYMGCDGALALRSPEKLGYKPLLADVCEETGLVVPAKVEECIREGGRLLVLHETMGVLPDIKSFLELGIPIVEDISHSAMAAYPLEEEEPSAAESPKPENQTAGTKKKRRASWTSSRYVRCIYNFGNGKHGYHHCWRRSIAYCSKPQGMDCAQAYC